MERLEKTLKEEKNKMLDGKDFFINLRKEHNINKVL